MLKSLEAQLCLEAFLLGESRQCRTWEHWFIQCAIYYRVQSNPRKIVSVGLGIIQQRFVHYAFDGILETPQQVCPLWIPVAGLISYKVSREHHSGVGLDLSPKAEMTVTLTLLRLFPISALRFIL